MDKKLSRDRQIDKIFNEVDDLMWKGEIFKINCMVEGWLMIVDALSVDIIIAILTITFPIRAQLKIRPTFFDAAEKIIDDAKLLEGLQ